MNPTTFVFNCFLECLKQSRRRAFGPHYIFIYFRLPHTTVRESFSQKIHLGLYNILYSLLCISKKRFMFILYSYLLTGTWPLTVHDLYLLISRFIKQGTICNYFTWFNWLPWQFFGWAEHPMMFDWNTRWI